MRRHFPYSLILLALLLLIVLAWPVGLKAGRGLEARPQGPPGERRVALVIGNADYKTGRLRNPVNDANDMTAALKQLGFEVIPRTNADMESMIEAIQDFGKKLRSAEVGLFYFAGHGVQLNQRSPSLLAQGNAHLKSDRLNKSAETNAPENFQQVLQLDPANKETEEGLLRTAGRYDELREAQIQRGVQAGVKIHLERAEKVVESDERVARIRTKLARLETKPAEPITLEPLVKPSTFTNSIGMRFVLILSGSFNMGSLEGEGSWNEHSLHRVEITRSFYLGVHEVTQAQWKEIMGENPSLFKGDDHPVERVSWDDVQTFIHRLNQKEGTNKYRLPTEAEWEYACRAGSEDKWCFGSDAKKLGDFAWYDSNSGGKTRPVGQKKCNCWGLCDMHGNVWEWCQDWNGDSRHGHSPVKDPSGPSKGSFRALRGGCWLDDADCTRCAVRTGLFPDVRYFNIGFRLARTY